MSASPIPEIPTPAIRAQRPQYAVRASDHFFKRPDSRSKCRRLLPQDRATLRFLRDLDAFRLSLLKQSSVESNGMYVNWLLPFRHDFRELIAGKPCEALRMDLRSRKPDDPALPLTLWLLGRTANRLKTYELEKADAEQSALVRRHFARALSRVGLWVRLRQLANDYPDDQFVQSMFDLPQKEKFAERLSRFAERMDDSGAAEAALASRMPLWTRHELSEPTPPKAAGWMRAILQRIRRWVRGDLV